jgi:GTP cyclohydrolase I
MKSLYIPLKKMLAEMTQRLEAKSGHIEMTFDYFVRKAAPISDVKSLMDYQVTFIGELVKEIPTITVKVVVPITSLCPCSKKISDFGAHNQRSHVTITAKTKGFFMD